MKSQTERVLEYMINVGPITPLDALEKLGCFRLPARILDLKKRGYNIKDRWINHTNKSGEVKQYKEYWLGGDR